MHPAQSAELRIDATRITLSARRGDATWSRWWNVAAAAIHHTDKATNCMTRRECVAVASQQQLLLLLHSLHHHHHHHHHYTDLVSCDNNTAGSHVPFRQFIKRLSCVSSIMNKWHKDVRNNMLNVITGHNVTWCQDQSTFNSTMQFTSIKIHVYIEKM